MELTTSVGSFGRFKHIVRTADMTGSFNVVDRHLGMEINTYSLRTVSNVQLQNIPIRSGL